ncbi:hypothetical protein ANMWB30_23780 [Arthrobacter sp. MWB30]|nr:hypothetical protein ANMWB30_23780 [Arthrobacter sp. MWB30]
MKKLLLAFTLASAAVALTGCIVVQPPAAAPTRTTTPTPTVDPYYAAEADKILNPKPFPITGNVIADLETAGMVPGESYQSVFNLAKERLCDTTNSDTSPNFTKLVEKFDATAPELVRVAIAYGCPERLKPAWNYIDKTYVK